MIYILIDTCSWINLLNKNKENTQLNSLKFWIENRHVQLLVPDLILREWNEHKEKQRENFLDHWKTIEDHAKKAARLYGNYPFAGMKLKLDFINEQFKIIDDLLLSSSHQITISEAIKISLPDKLIPPKQAPFHHKADSMKDAYIYFSSLEYCDWKGIDEIYFLSENSSDFGKPLGNKKGDNRIIHPDLLTDFPNIKVNYFGNIGMGINELAHNLPIPPGEPRIPAKPDKNFDFIEINKNEGIFLQLYTFITQLKREIEFIPIHLLVRHYPFRLDPNSYTYFSIFQINTDNNSLIEFFKSFEIVNNERIEILKPEFFENVEDAKGKIKEVLMYLSQNLIFHIQHSQLREEINIRIIENVMCDCAKCNLKRLNLVESLEMINKNEARAVNDLMEQAYLQYRIGSYLLAAENLKLAYDLAIKEGRYTAAFISKFNLKKLRILIRSNYWGDRSQDKLLGELDQIDLDDEFDKLKTTSNLKILEWIKDEEFFSKAKDNIQLTVSKIHDHYYTYLNGGWSSNSNVWILISEYAELIGFLNSNFIFYDQFQEFESLSSNFFEGIFASHSMNRNNNSRLETFDDWLMTQLLVSLNAERIKKLYRRYKLKHIEYSPSATNGDSFIELSNNFLSNPEGLIEELQKSCDIPNRSFGDKFNNIFCNIITMTFLVDFDEDYQILYSEKLITFLEQENLLNKNSIPYLITYLRNVGDKFDCKILKRFFMLGLKNPKYHGEDYFEVFVAIVEKTKLRIEINKLEFDLIVNMIFGSCQVCNSMHPVTEIIPLYRIIRNDDYKEELKKLIYERLINDFNFELFYLATLFEIVEYDDKLFKIAIDEFNPQKKQKFPKFFLPPREENRFPRLGRLLNLCFKYDIAINATVFQKFMGLDPYYDWLIDMENFDYSLFDPKWIGEYPTRYYYKRIANVDKVKQTLVRHLKREVDEEVEHIYVNLFIRRKWEANGE